MTVYKGQVGCRQLAQVLHDALIAEGYQESSSDITTDGRVYSSLGTDNQSLFFIRIKDPKSNYLTIGIYEKYDPNPTNGLPGVFTNGFDGDNITWNTSGTADRIKVNYIFNVTLDRVIIYVDGMKAEPNKANSLTYIGLPKRYDANDKGGNFAGMAFTTRGPFNSHNTWRALRNRALVPQSDYEMDFYNVARSYGWGKQLFFSPIFIGRDDEGARGELDGLYHLEKTDANIEVQPGDTFVKDGKTYMVIDPYDWGSDTLYHAYDYVIEL